MPTVETAAVIDPQLHADSPPAIASGGAHRVVDAVRRTPFTTGLLATLWGLGAWTHSLMAGPSPGLRVGVGLVALGEGRWWTLASSLWWCPDLPTYVVVSVGLVGLLGPAEARLGTRRAMMLAGIVHLTGLVLGFSMIGLGAALGDPWSTRLAQSGAIGPSTVIFGVALAGTTRLGVLWRRRLRLVLLVVLMMLAVYSGLLRDVLALAAGLVGLALGAADPSTRTRTGTGSRWRASKSESRLLVALIVAASAAGPLIAAVTGTAIGPLSVARFVLLSPMPTSATLLKVCANPALVQDCSALASRLRLRGPGPAILSVLPVLVLLVLAACLRRGRRFAWWAAPIYADGAVIGWTLDFMRRREDAMPGVTEFLIATAALQFQGEGAALLSLSGAPLARGEQPDALQRLLDQISRSLEPVYGFRSLLAFKAKFQPDFRPLHLTYPDTTALPAIGTSVARAYLPDLDAATTVTLIGKLLRRRPTRT